MVQEEKITSSTLAELASKYSVCPKTLKKWLLPFKDYIGQPSGYIYTPDQVRKIIQKLGAW